MYLCQIIYNICTLLLKCIENEAEITILPVCVCLPVLAANYLIKNGIDMNETQKVIPECSSSTD